MNDNPLKILVIRNDKLGDFMLAWPALSLLKQQYPESEISVLIPAYTRPMAELCPWIDNILIDDYRVSAISDAKHLSALIKKHNFDASITLFSEFRVALALWLSRIPLRISPATKLWQVFYNHTLTQRRSHSKKPEYMYNVDLIKYFIKTENLTPKQLQKPPFLKFDQNEVNRLKSEFLSRLHLGNTNKLVFIHPGSGGSANNLSLDQYATLIKHLSTNTDLYFILTAGPNEIDEANRLSDLIKNVSHAIFHSTDGLINFSKHIAICDLFISGSTGPLHIAGALNARTATFYPTRRSATSLRWQTMNQENKRLAFSPNIIEKNSDMSTISIKDSAEEILNKLI
jgi:ADP-heptose:LPS heptosyltransferase